MTTERATRAARRARAEAGYTLIELLVVLAILGLLVAIAVPRVVGYLEGSKVKTAEIQLAQIDAALDLYRLDLGDFPSEEQGLKALIERPDGTRVWNGPYLNRADGIIDPWGRPYRYERAADARAYLLMSFGADGKEGGEGEDVDVEAKALR